MDDRENNDELEKDFGSAFGINEESSLGFSKIVEEFKSLDYKFLIPVNKFLNPGLLKKKAVRWVMLFGLLPLIYAWAAVKFNLDFEQIVWLIEIYFCLFWALYFYSVIHPAKTTWKQGIGYALFTTIIGIPTLLSFQSFPVISDLYEGLYSRSLFSQLTGFILGVGILEETCKALPLIIFGLRKKTIKGIREGVFLGFLSGLGFAASEGVTYTVRATVNAIQYGSASGQLITFLDRAMSGPLQHSAWAGVVGWFIGYAATKEGTKWQIVVVGILFMALLHGLFDTFSSGLIGIILAAAGYLIFMAYLLHNGKENNSNILIETDSNKKQIL